METILSLDQHDLGFFTDEDTEITKRRMAARAVMKNADGKIAVMHFSKIGTYKLPGGGRDEGESMREALDREMREETGYTLKGVEQLCLVEEYRYVYGMHQTSYVYTATCDSFVGTALTDSERDLGMELVWADSYEKAIELIHASNEIDEDGSPIGLELMKIRETEILKFARQSEL